MTLHLDSAVIKQLCDEQIAYDAAQLALDGQRQGNFQLPTRMDVNVPTGFFRAMPAALDEYMGAKIMTLAKGVGNRYLLLVYLQKTGELLAMLDASEVTRLRTAATTALAGNLLRPEGTSVLGIIGTGFEAEGHLRAFAQLWPLTKVHVFSRSVEKRQEFADRLGKDLGLEVEPVDRVEDVTSVCPVTVLCTKATEPVVDGTSFAPDAVVLSIGSTRPDLRELDVATFARARTVLVDDLESVVAESGDVTSAITAGAVERESFVSMADWTGNFGADGGDKDLSIFKSVGTALQDLALAAVLIKNATDRGLGREIGDITELKAVK
ncbi:ornithine cyclodeaminase family protein [Rhodococcus sp. T2V]|uniref:ornithine cyclodeaminase family protein n=1 Tax=Rhodococcus sp. T2V TaxID=3034164 RepID=UPI0023E2C94B|nr:ornithine cyclodeaminase family protein [Rhodococcus sp. T2V]MDF3311061.1 ornithine cyclodeaminase family protein [Rhodococcus sp. T2V]